MKKVLFFSLLLLFAITVQAQTSGDYRSYKSGNWNTAIWQKYNGSSWVNVATYPSSTDGAITILDTTDVTLNLSLVVDQLVVAAGGTLELTSSYTLTLANGAGDDMTVNGKFLMDNGTVVSPGNVKINGTFLWTGGNVQAPLTNSGITSIEEEVTLYSVFTNNATVNWTGGYFYFQNGTIENNGTFNSLTNNYLYNSNGGTFNNNATGVFNQKSSGITYSRITFNNKGILNINAGTFLVDQGVFTSIKTINFSSGTFDNEATVNLNAGTKITGTGNWNQSYNTANINLALIVPATVTINFNGGTIAGSGSLKVNGLMNWNHGAINVTTSTTATAVVNISYDDVQLYSTLTNAGTINWTTNTYITFYGGTIINNKAFNAYGNGYFYNSSGGTFTNGATGVFTRSIGTGTFSNRITFNNNGTVNINSGIFKNENDAIFNNAKKIVFNNGTLDNETTVNLNTGTTITGTGKISESYGTMNMNDSIVLPAGIAFYLTNSGSASIAGTGALKVNGTMFWQNGDIRIPTFIQSAATLFIDGSSTSLYSTLTNNGIVNWSVGYIYFYGGSFINNNSFNIFGNDKLYNSSSGSFTNTITGIVTKNSFGTTTVSIPFTNAGNIKGIGTYDFETNLTNTGTFAPGVDTATGILTTGTNYVNKSLAIKMKGSSPGLNYDRLLVNGNIVLTNDTIRVTALGLIPAGNYPVLIFTGTRTGTFKTVKLPTGYTLSYQGNKVIVNVPAAFTGSDDKEVVANSFLELTSGGELFTVSPNPATSQILVTIKSSKSFSAIDIFNASGEKMKSVSIGYKTSILIDVASFAPGTYILKSNGEKVQHAKFIKL